MNLMGRVKRQIKKLVAGRGLTSIIDMKFGGIFLTSRRELMIAIAEGMGRIIKSSFTKRVSSIGLTALNAFIIESESTTSKNRKGASGTHSRTALAGDPLSNWDLVYPHNMITVTRG